MTAATAWLSVTNRLASLEAAWVERLGWALLHSLWQVALVAAALAVTLRTMRRASPNARYLAGCLALAAMALLPAVTVLTIVHGGPPMTETSIEARPISPPSARQVSRPFAAAEHELEVTGGRSDRTADSQEASPSYRSGETRLAAPEPVAAVSTSPWFAERLRPALPWLVAGWAAGVLLLSLRLLAARLGLRRLRTSRVAPAADELKATLARLARRLAVTRPVRLLESALVEVPTVFGWVRPVILLPAAAVARLSPAQLEALLAHELAHVRRHDYLANLAQNLLETGLFYHPAAWWASARVRQEREHCCDDLAAEACGDRGGYARALLRMEELRPASARLALSAAGGDLLCRVRRLVAPADRDVGSPSWPAALFAAAAVAATLAALDPAANPRRGRAGSATHRRPPCRSPGNSPCRH